jgi:hypothetical protein
MSKGRRPEEHSDLPVVRCAIDEDSSHKLVRLVKFPLYPPWRDLTIILLALWYLLTPPLVGDRAVNSRAPMSEWNRAGMYNSQEECQAAKNNFAAAIAKLDSPGQDRAQGILSIELSQCLTSDDYRLEAAQPSASPTPAGRMQPLSPETHP